MPGKMRVTNQARTKSSLGGQQSERDDKEVDNIVKKSLTQEDKKFLVQITQSNRNFLTSVHQYLLAVLVAFTALLISLINIITGFGLGDKNIAWGAAVIVIIGMMIYWKKVDGYNEKNIRDLNEQYQKYLLEMYPDLKDKKFIH